MLKFNGSNSYGVIPAALLGGKSNFTIEMTVATNESRTRGDAWDSREFIGLEVSGNCDEFGFGVNGGYLSLFTGNNDSYYQSSYKINDNQKKNIVLTNTNGYLRLYLVDKNDDGSNKVILATQAWFTTSGNYDYYLGYNNSGWYCQFDLYYLAIYNTPLDTSKFFTNETTPVSKYKNKYKDGKLIDYMGKYNLPLYNIEYKYEPHTFYSNLKIESDDNDTKRTTRRGD